jgi:hypothetical protein
MARDSRVGTSSLVLHPGSCKGRDFRRLALVGLLIVSHLCDRNDGITLPSYGAESHENVVGSRSVQSS